MTTGQRRLNDRRRGLSSSSSSGPRSAPATPAAVAWAPGAGLALESALAAVPRRDRPRRSACWMPAPAGEPARPGCRCGSARRVVLVPGRQSADDDDLLARLLAIVGVDHIGEHAGDVVRPAAADRQVDELIDGRVEVGELRQRRPQRLVGDHVGQAVGAEQEPVTDPGLNIARSGSAGMLLCNARMTSDRCGWEAAASGVSLPSSTRVWTSV